ncbi:MAG: nuclear transport factor 2 family protein [Trueperaceae bacterium]|nr:nuclear transport factor 2 family protein [Trueperaceae bacterium]
MDHRTRFLAYLDAYARKDIDASATMLAPDATLRDRNLSVRGHRAVVAETVENFRNADTIEIEVLQTYEREDGVAGELRIVVDGTVELHVVDVIEFDAAGLMKAIRSYKGRGD